MRPTTMRTLGVVTMVVGALAAAAVPAGAFPDEQRVLIRSALGDRCVRVQATPQSADEPPLRLALAECDERDTAQRLRYSWGTLRVDSVPGMCVAPAERQALALAPCEEDDRRQLWVSQPLTNDAPTDHIQTDEDGKSLSWEAAKDGTVRLAPTSDRAAQEWLYTPLP
ncbi:RICIN domain-containing protein (plasmid) [Streptomyces europaeiscabiei]|uniref:ricin-type beta-trefoil lectin domain protein n=1 Tax=Streptomyces europaeiscabiei TaxID=146819 RepID=UPI002E805FD8|nr:ricin-type beta-trefoil lectin domain protein [Streptomyces europaeiscabiei]WUD38865.1 RICIN domain-containing protein [Streptomyces europaeiscabiei]